MNRTNEYDDSIYKLPEQLYSVVPTVVASSANASDWAVRIYVIADGLVRNNFDKVLRPRDFLDVLQVKTTEKHVLEGVHECADLQWFRLYGGGRFPRKI